MHALDFAWSYKWKMFFDKFTLCLLFGSFIFVKSSLLITSMLASPISPLLVGTPTSSSFLQSSNWKLQRLLCKSWIKLLDCKLDCMSARSNCAQNFGPETCPTRSGLRLPWGTIHNWHKIFSLLSSSSHIWSVLIGVKYRNHCFNFGCLFTFYYSAWANQIKTKLQSCNLKTGQSISYKYVNQFWLNLPHPNSKK